MMKTLKDKCLMMLYLSYSKKLKAAEGEDGAIRIDLNKLTDEHIAMLVDKMATKKPDMVEYMYLFPAKGSALFYYREKLGGFWGELPSARNLTNKIKI